MRRVIIERSRARFVHAFSNAPARARMRSNDVGSGARRVAPAQPG